MMKTAIIGMGALGLMYGSYILEAYGPDDFVAVMDDERYEKHKNDIYSMNGRILDINLVRASEAETADIVIVGVKGPALDEAIEAMENLVGEDTVVFSILNGVSSEEKLGAAFGKKKVVPCTVIGMDAMREGTTGRFTQLGIVQIGKTCEYGTEEGVKKIYDYLNGAGITCEIKDDIMYFLWNKLMINVGINQTCMVYETNYGGALSVPERKDMLTRAMKETVAVARAMGIGLTEENIDNAIRIIGTLDPEGYPSMRQDAVARRKSEVELFAGTIVRLGNKLGIPVPVNEFYLKRIDEIESEY